MPGTPTYRELRSVLVARGKTVTQMAREMGVSRTAVYRAMHGDPWLAKLRERIAEYLRTLLTSA